MGANDGGLRIAVEDVAFSTQAVQHAEDQRRLVYAGEGIQPGVDESGGGMPVVGVMGDKKGFTEDARRPELGRRVHRCQACPLEPADAFPELALRPPEEVEACRQLERRLRVDSQEVLERDTSVVLYATKDNEVRLFRPGGRRRGFLPSGTEVVARVAFTDGFKFADCDELLDGELADGLEQLIQAAVFLLPEE